MCVLCRSWWRWSVFWWESEGLILTEIQRLKACVIDSDSPLLHLIADHESDYFLKLLSLALRDLWQHSLHWLHIGLWWMSICGCLWFSNVDRCLVWFVAKLIIFGIVKLKQAFNMFAIPNTRSLEVAISVDLKQNWPSLLS